MKQMKKLGFIFLFFNFCMACSTGQTKKLNPKEAFMSHWKEAGGNVEAAQVQLAQSGFYRGNAIVDGHPVEEFFNPTSGEFSLNGPVTGIVETQDTKKVLYKDVMNELAHEVAQGLPESSRIAVLDFTSDESKTTRLSSNLALKLEMGLTSEGRTVVDRAKIDSVLKEHQFQQSQGALFDPTTSARLGKFVGANTVAMGSYHLSLPRKLLVSVRVVSVETARVLFIKEKEIPLDGSGLDNRQEITELVQSN